MTTYALNLYTGLPDIAGSSGGGVDSVTASNSTLTISPTTGDVLASINLSNANTWLADQSVPDEAYGVGWNGSLEVPTKNAVYDKINSLVSGVSSVSNADGTLTISPTTGAVIASVDQSFNFAWLGAHTWGGVITIDASSAIQLNINSNFTVDDGGNVNSQILTATDVICNEIYTQYFNFDSATSSHFGNSNSDTSVYGSSLYLGSDIITLTGAAVIDNAGDLSMGATGGNWTLYGTELIGTASSKRAFRFYKNGGNFSQFELANNRVYGGEDFGDLHAGYFDAYTAGTAGAPSYTGNGVLTTGFYLPAGGVTAGISIAGTSTLLVSAANSTFANVLKPRTGSATAGTVPVQFTSGALLTVAVAGGVEFLTDKYYGTITTGAARKELALADIALTTGRIALTTTNGRLTDLASVTADGSGNIAATNLSGTNTGDQLIFKTIAVSGQSDVVADTTADTLTLVAGTNVTITTNAGTDTITIAASGGSGTFAITETEVDFGTTPVWGKTFTVTDGAVTAASKIMPSQSGNVATSRVGDDYEWDSIVYAAIGGTGQFTLTANVFPGPIVGKRKVLYTVA